MNERDRETTVPGPDMPDDDWLRTAGHVAVHGLGREGRSVLADLREANPHARVVVLDDRAPADDQVQALRDTGVQVVVGADDGARRVREVDLVVRSPGVPHDHPAQATAREAGVAVTSVLNVFLARHRPDNVVAITGTKGKSTTARLVGHMLAAGGQAVEVAGNVGLSVFDLPRPPADLDTLVIELSSYQLSDLRAPLTVGAWLNLHADHHTWHGGAEAYARAKGRIGRLADTLVVNAADSRVMARTAAHEARVTFDASGDPVRVGPHQTRRARLEATLATSSLVGMHNLANITAAATLAGLRGVDLDTALASVIDFEPLPHRLQVVHEADGLTWIDDSICTIPEAAVAALASFPDVPVTLLAGGFDRGQDHAPLVEAIVARADGAAAVTVVALPPTGERLAAALADHPRVQVTVVDDLSEAVAAARVGASAPGLVLLSPAAPSFHAFSSYAERGDEFAHLARSTP